MAASVVAFTAVAGKCCAMEKRKDPISPVDDPIRTQARAMLAAARFAALSFRDPGTGGPGISRIAFGLGPDGQPVTLISALSVHHTALVAEPACAFMVGEPGAKGDPLTHPRLMVTAQAQFIARDDPDHLEMRDHWLAAHPKSTLYIDFADFTLVRLVPQSALWNGGFGKAARLTAADLS
jgi:heme iron utilization protein